MKSATVLLVDLNPGDGLCGALRQILESSDQLEIKLRQESIAIDSTSLSRQLAKIVLHFEPEVARQPAHDRAQSQALGEK